MKDSRRGMSIQLKIVSLTVLILAASTGVSLYFTAANQRRNLLESTQRTLAANTELLSLTIRNLMLAAEAPIAVRAMTSFKGIEEFKEIALYRADGSTAFSDYATIDRVNAYQKKFRFARTPRVEGETEDDPNFTAAVMGRVPVIVESAEEKTLEYFSPIINFPECRGCHGYGGFVRGVAVFAVDLSGVYDRIQAARDLQAVISASVGVLIAGLLILMLNRTIIAPVLAIGRVARTVGEGNFDARVTLRSRDELGALGGTLNEMVAGLRERSELIVRNRVIDERNRENRKYLDTIQEGLLLIGRDLVIGDQYSLYLERLFARTAIAGTSFPDFIYPDADARAQEREELAGFLEILFTNTVSEMEMILSINPLMNKTLMVGSGSAAREIIVDVMFHRITEGDSIQNVMVIFTDRTDIVRARKELAIERERSQSELEQIAAILKAGPGNFRDICDQADGALAGLRAGLASLGERRTLDGLFREFHSLKGAARYLGLRNAERLAHEIEGVLSAVRESGRGAAAAEVSRAGALAEELAAEVASIRALNERFREFAAGPGRAAGAGAAESPFSALADSLARMAADIARDLGKDVAFRSHGSLEDSELLRKLRDPLIHLVRNAVDHGLEDRMERLSAGKPAAGKVTLTAVRRGGTTLVRVSDDGRGIDFRRVERRAVELGLLSPGELPAARARLLGILFSPRFSTRTGATEISGRGVGLDAVQDAVRALGGKIYIAARPGVGTSFTLRIPG